MKNALLLILLAGILGGCGNKPTLREGTFKVSYGIGKPDTLTIMHYGNLHIDQYDLNDSQGYTYAKGVFSFSIIKSDAKK